MSNELTIGNVTSRCVFLHFFEAVFLFASVNPDGGKRLFTEFRQNTGKKEKKRVKAVFRLRRLQNCQFQKFCFLYTSIRDVEIHIQNNIS